MYDTSLPGTEFIATYTVGGKILEEENFGEFGERLAIRQSFPHQYLYKLPTDSPNFSSPKTLEPLIRQNFPTYGIHD